MDDAPTGSALFPETEVAAAQPYRVLARKYRPSNFDDLIGQSAMVRTLSNAFTLGRIHQAYLLCGVRGVGKTTTARILARAFNYHRPAHDGEAAIDRPTIDMPGFGTHCQAIIESRHVDVIEMDAASHTGIDDIREIIESARYRPVMARTKVYIIDEVHMLSKSAFNGLLKTLEEPPEHVKFLFATTEIDKVPVTVRSRCQRFDLRRIEAPDLIAHLSTICAKEGVAIEPEALAIIARAAEGSVRDSLSLLDQAIAHGAAGSDGAIEAALVRDMLGLADRARIIDLFEALMSGALASALDGLKHLHDHGADPVGVLSALAEFVHLVTRLKIVPDAAKDPALTAEERMRGLDFAGKLGLPVLTRAWQMLSKGLNDVRDAPRPLAAADMVLVRLAYAADLPTPDEVIRKLQSSPPSTGGGGGGAASGGGGGASSALRQVAAPAAGARAAIAVRPVVAESRGGAMPGSIEDVIALAAAHRDVQLKVAIERDVRLVRFEPGSIEFEPAPGASRQLAGDLMRRLNEWTGTRWMVVLANSGGQPTVRERAEAAQAAKRADLEQHPAIKGVMETFPGARIVAIRDVADALPPPEPPPPPVMGDDEVGYGDLDPGPGADDDVDF